MPLWLLITPEYKPLSNSVHFHMCILLYTHQLNLFLFSGHSQKSLKKSSCNLTEFHSLFSSSYVRSGFIIRNKFKLLHLVVACYDYHSLVVSMISKYYKEISSHVWFLILLHVMTGICKYFNWLPKYFKVAIFHAVLMHICLHFCIYWTTV